jgi:hypothetical protein
MQLCIQEIKTNVVGYKSPVQKRPDFTYTGVHVKNVWIIHMDKRVI